jgi:uncharacterized membrane protein affecting hemolysin expression
MIVIMVCLLCTIFSKKKKKKKSNHVLQIYIWLKRTNENEEDYAEDEYYCP